MVMHARKHIRLDGYFDRNQTHSYENSGSKYSKSPFGDNCNEKSPAADSGASLVAAMDSPENSRRPSPRYLHKASYAQRLKERDHHHDVKSPMSKERSNRSREHSHHHHTSSSSSQHHGQQSNSTPGSSRNKNNTSETSASNYARSNHDRSHVEVKMEPEKERKSQVGDWSEHVSSSGKKYYYNCRTEVSQWEKPREWVEWEKVHGINKSAEVSIKSKEKNSGVTPSKGTERHSNSNSRSSANSSSRTSHHHQHGSSSSHPQRESHSHSHRHDRSHQSSSNRSHSVNDHHNADQASSASSSSSSSSNSSNSSASANRASAGTASNSGRRDERPRGETALADEAPEKSETRLNDHGIRQESGTNHLTNYHHHNSASSSNKRSNSRKDSAQDMDISPDSSFSVDNNNFISTGHQYPQQQHSSSGHPQLQQMSSGTSLTPNRLSKSSNSGGNYFASTPSAMTTPSQSLGTGLTPTNSASSVTPQLLSPSQVTLANLPRLISQLTGTRGLPNLSEMSQQEALQTVQQALQLTKQLGGLSRSPHGATSSNHDSKNALALTPALLSAAAALRDGQTGNQNNFYPLGSEGARIDSSNTHGGTPSSDFHSHSSRQTSPASSAGSPTSISVTVNNSSNVTTSVAAAMAAAAAAANSSGSLASAVSLKPSTPSLTPSLANYYREDLVTHVTGWQADHAERQASRYSEEAHNIGSLNSTRVSAELKMARSLVRLAEIQATLQEQRILFLRQQVKELEDRRSQNSFMMDS